MSGIWSPEQLANPLIPLFCLGMGILGSLIIYEFYQVISKKEDLSTQENKQ